MYQLLCEAYTVQTSWAVAMHDAAYMYLVGPEFDQYPASTTGSLEMDNNKMIILSDRECVCVLWDLSHHGLILPSVLIMAGVDIDRWV